MELGNRVHVAAFSSAFALSVLELKTRSWLKGSADDGQISQQSSKQFQADSSTSAPAI